MRIQTATTANIESILLHTTRCSFSSKKAQSFLHLRYLFHELIAYLYVQQCASSDVRSALNRTTKIDNPSLFVFSFSSYPFVRGAPNQHGHAVPDTTTIEPLLECLYTYFLTYFQRSFLQSVLVGVSVL